MEHQYSWGQALPPSRTLFVLGMSAGCFCYYWEQCKPQHDLEGNDQKKKKLCKWSKGNTRTNQYKFKMNWSKKNVLHLLHPDTVLRLNCQIHCNNQVQTLHFVLVCSWAPEQVLLMLAAVFIPLRIFFPLRQYGCSSLPVTVKIITSGFTRP